jgi:thymidylate kinase
VLIEVAGIDGSGKTTLIHHLRGHLHEKGRPAYTRTWPSTVKRIAADTAHQAADRPWWEFFDPAAIETAAAFEHLAAVHQHLLPLDPGRQVVLTDTYTVRWLATALLHGAEAGPLAALYARLPAPDLSLWLDTDADTARARLLARPQRDHLTTTGNPGRLDRYRQSLARAVDLVPYPVRRLDGGAPTAQVLAQAQPLLEAALR